MYSLYDFRVGRLGTTPELYTVRPYGLKDRFIHKQLLFSGQLRIIFKCLKRSGYAVKYPDVRKESSWVGD